MMHSHNPTLVLNADYTPLSHFPLSTIGWQDAIRGVFQGKYDVVAEYDTIVRSQRVEMFVPSVVALREYQQIAQRVAFTRYNVFLRDKFRCQYCNEKFDTKELTYDHVIPRCKGGTSTWDNIVSACEPCNTEKGKHSEMKPIRKPKKPTLGELRTNALMFPPRFMHETWRDHLYWNLDLDP